MKLAKTSDGRKYRVDNKEVHEITATVKLSDSTKRSYTEAKTKLSQKLASVIIQNENVILNNNAEQLTATVGISAPGEKFNLVRDYFFAFEGREFSEEQIKTALKNYYPEQFV